MLYPITARLENGDAKPLSQSRSVPKEFDASMRQILEQYAAAEPAVVAPRGPLQQFIDGIDRVFHPGKIFEPIAEQFGAALRKQWSARVMYQSWRNCLALVAEAEIGLDFMEIPAKV